MRTGAGNENTARAKPTWLRDVSDYRSEKGLKISFACCSAEELATFLEKCFAEVKPKKGTGCEYSKSSYLPAQSATKRHLWVLKRPFNIFTAEAFAHVDWDSRRRVERLQEGRLEKAAQTQESNFRGRLGEDQRVFWRRPQRANSSETDRKLLVRYYQPLVPRSMQDPKRWGETTSSSRRSAMVTYGLVLEQTSCPRTALAIETVANSALVDASRPIAALRLLLEYLHPSVDRLFHVPFKSSDKVWFMKRPLGHNLLAKLLSRISEKSNCSKKHLCLRKELRGIDARVMVQSLMFHFTQNIQVRQQWRCACNLRSSGGEPVICDSAQHTTWVAQPPPSPTTNNTPTRCPQQTTQYLSTGIKRKNLKKNNLAEHIKLIMGRWVGTTRFTHLEYREWSETTCTLAYIRRHVSSAWQPVS